MFLRFSTLLCVVFLLRSLSLAQDAAPVDDWKPAVTNQEGKEYPQVNSEGRIRFRVHAPEATSVSCTFRDSSEFVKDDDGNWTGYTRKLDEGFHYYELIIDGAKVPDPNSNYLFRCHALGQRRGSACEGQRLLRCQESSARPNA